MKMLFDFEGDELAYVLRLIEARVEVLKKLPQSQKRDVEVVALCSFTKKLGPVIQRGMLEEAHLRARLN